MIQSPEQALEDLVKDIEIKERQDKEYRDYEVREANNN